ncbi:MAG: iron ABC transporter permease, partial [Actinomycetota bacterium]|nr:iron ABC transporter permease [Actinomycetota bacterium]
MIALLPLGYLVIVAARADPAVLLAQVVRPRSLSLLASSVGLAAMVTAVSVVLGVGAAWLIERTTLRGRRVWAVLAALPLAIPSYVAAFSWISLLPDIAGFLGALVVLSLSCFPYVYLPTAAALRRLDPAMEETSRSLGVGPYATFWRVTLPQLRPAVAAGALLAALYTLSDFGAVSILRYDTFTRVIFTSFNASFDRTPAVVLSGMLVLVTAVIVLAEARTRGRARYARLGSGAARMAARISLRRSAMAAYAALGLLAAAALGVPLVSMGYWLSVGRSGEFDLPKIVEAVGGSLVLAGGGAVFTMLLALPVGLLAARHTGRLPGLLERAAYLGHAVPAIVVALSLVFFTVRYAFGLYLSVPLVLFAYAVLFLPLAVGAVRASAAQSPLVFEEVARSLGRSPRRVLATITLPLAAPGIAAGTALVFLAAMKELTATLVLHPTGMDTLAIRLWSETSTRSYAGAAPYAALLMLVSVIPTYLLGRDRRRTGDDLPGPGSGHS